ncbi:SHOCT domain-containing protein [Cryobacterium tagatosivorans]|uniref:SHOCT domain-containing protein n=1 Tax=Cryobacterium tagatosivorans TaxID=1259199 RepID=A0A4V3I6I0_9MICO|nr:SHOCT domain-containing protein [Cryobacterium tagatosivorans]TFB51523.1 SHOCT domain-containing protein [Cryobacterium tagatosivorans]
MPRRMGRPGLIGTMAHTAVVAGTATAVAGGVNRRQQARAQSKEEEAQRAAWQQQQYEQQQQQAPAPEAAPAAPEAAPAANDLTAQLQQLSSLKTAGVISEAEFSAAKAKLLGI